LLLNTTKPQVPTVQLPLLNTTMSDLTPSNCWGLDLGKFGQLCLKKLKIFKLMPTKLPKINFPKDLLKEDKTNSMGQNQTEDLLSWHLLTVLEGSLETLETCCICYREECQELLQVSVAGTEMILEHFGQAPMFLPTRNPAMDYTQAVSCFQLALALIIQREGRSTPILSKISLRSSRLQQNLGDRSLGIFWKGTNTTLQELHIINVHCIKNNLSL